MSDETKLMETLGTDTETWRHVTETALKVKLRAPGQFVSMLEGALCIAVREAEHQAEALVATTQERDEAKGALQAALDARCPFKEENETLRVDLAQATRELQEAQSTETALRQEIERQRVMYQDVYIDLAAARDAQARAEQALRDNGGTVVKAGLAESVAMTLRAMNATREALIERAEAAERELANMRDLADRGWHAEAQAKADLALRTRERDEALRDRDSWKVAQKDSRDAHGRATTRADAAEARLRKLSQ